MDYFLSIPFDTYERGLVDMHMKVWASAKKTKFLLSFHAFQAQQSFELTDTTTTTPPTSKSFGNEFDFTIGHKYTDQLGFLLGISTFSPGAIFKEQKGDGPRLVGLHHGDGQPVGITLPTVATENGGSCSSRARRVF